MFKDVPDEAAEDDDPIEITFRKMNAHNITFAPKYYPTAIVDFANTRGSER